MKKIFASFFIISIICNLFSTDVSGNQSGNWNLAESPYNIIGEITVPAGETLSIDTGVEVVAMGNYKINALGNILAIGTLNDTIRFHGEGGFFWGGIRLEDETNSSTFSYCRISNTDDMNDYGIHSINSPVHISFSLFDDHQKGLQFSGMASNDPSYMEIKHSKVMKIQKSGITVVDNSNVLIDSCEVTRCAIGGSPYGAIQLSLQNNSHSCNPTITKNYIHHNDMHGIAMANLFGYDNMAPTVEYNEVAYNYTGIYLYAGKGTYTWNHIHHNFVENNANSGAGVMLYGNDADAVFTYNEIHHNYTGFYLTDGATANLGNLNNADPNDDGYNCIYDNIFYTGEEFSVYNASSADVTAENCVWDDDPAIDVSIVDGNDNPAYGIVDYEPTLSPYAPPELNANLENFSINIEIKYPTFVLPTGLYIYRDGVLLEQILYSDIIYFDPVYGAETTYGISIVYEGGHESMITETTIFILHILNPPVNVYCTQYGYLTWEEAEPGSTSPFLYYNIYLDGDLQGTTTDLFYQLTGLINGLTYVPGVSAVFEAGESENIEYNFTYVSSDDDYILIENKLSNYPNPFNPSTEIRFQISDFSENEKAEIEIYNLKGQKIKQYSILNNQSSIVWNGTDQTGKPVSSGVYFYKLVSNGKDITSRKMLLLK